MSPASANIAPLHDALSALETVLARRTAALIDEVAHYPTPIARCDEQLTKLIEQRTHAVNQLHAVRAAAALAAATGQTDGLAAVNALLAGYPAPDDDDEAESVARLRAVTAAMTASR